MAPTLDWLRIVVAASVGITRGAEVGLSNFRQFQGNMITNSLPKSASIASFVATVNRLSADSAPRDT
jgi:hypothetical protein